MANIVQWLGAISQVNAAGNFTGKLTNAASRELMAVSCKKACRTLVSKPVMPQPCQ
jgi:hypothetical protein